jgi:hypothetical protein
MYVNRLIAAWKPRLLEVRKGINWWIEGFRLEEGVGFGTG